MAVIGAVRLPYGIQATGRSACFWHSGGSKEGHLLRRRRIVRVTLGTVLTIVLVVVLLAWLL